MDYRVKFRPSFSFLCVLVLVCSESVQATPEPLKMASAVAYDRVRVTSADWVDNTHINVQVAGQDRNRSSSFLIDATSGEYRNAKPIHDGAISPDQRWLIRVSKGNWLLTDLTTNTATVIAPAQQALALGSVSLATRAQWSPDSRWFAIYDAVQSPLAARTPSSEVTRNGVKTDILDGLVPKSDIPWSRPEIMIGSPQAVNHLKRIAIPEDNAKPGGWGGNGRYYFKVLRRGTRSNTSSYTAFRVADAVTGTVNEVYRVKGFNQSAAISESPDGRFMAISADIDSGRWDDFVSLILLDRHGQVRRLTKSQYVTDFVWSRDSKFLYVFARDGGFDRIFSVSLGGSVTAVTNGAAVSIFNPVLSPDGKRLVFETLDPYGTSKLACLDLRSGRYRNILDIDRPLDRYAMATFERFRWQARDGLWLNGYLFLPPQFHRDGQYPLLVDVHGGGVSAPLSLSNLLGYSSDLPLPWHAWARLGYVVFVPDMRSSGEYGAEVASARYAANDWDSSLGIKADSLDIEDGVSALISRGYIDRRRLAIFGHSAGGARVSYILASTNRYAAGIIHDPAPSGALPNSIFLISGGRTGQSLLQEGSSIEENPDVYTGGFLFDANRVRTPTLIMLGNPERGAAPPLSAEVLYSLLRMNNIPARLVRFPEDGHVPSSTASTMIRFDEMQAWLSRFVPACGASGGVAAC